MSILPRPWRTVEADIEDEIAAKMRDLRAAEKQHDFRFIQGELAGLERALEIARREPGEPMSSADDNLYPS